MSHIKIMFVLACCVVAESSCQIVWTKHAKNPVLPVWLGSVDDPSALRHAYAPSVSLAQPEVSATFGYQMWFTSATTSSSVLNISYAFSPNGTDWFLYSKNPVMKAGPTGSFDAVYVADPLVIRVGDQLRLYYTGYNGNRWAIGVATSTDGVNWKKHPSNPVLTPGSGWESIQNSTPRVYYNGSSFIILYTGWDGAYYNVGMATSPDGFAWTKHPSNPVLRRGNPGLWDQTSVIANSLVVKNGTFYLFYANLHPATTLGFATSPDGINWTKYASNPIFSGGPSGTWEGQISHGSMILQNDLFRFWYCGLGSATGWQIGYATSPLTYSAEPTNAAETQARSYSLSESFPNPFNPDASIQYSVPTNQHVTIKIYDALGQEVTTLVDEMKPAGSYTAVWNAQHVASGLYWYRMTAGTYSSAKKMLLTK